MPFAPYHIIDPDTSVAHPMNAHPSFVGAGMQSGRAQPNVAVAKLVDEEKDPPLTSKTIVYCAA